MKNIDYIKNMNKEQLVNFLWIWGINTMTAFMTSGGTEIMNISELHEWLDKEEFECKQTHVSYDMNFDSNYLEKDKYKAEIAEKDKENES